MSDTSRTLPIVGPRPEIMVAMRALGTDRSRVDETYRKLRGIVLEYLPKEASLSHGEIVGQMLALALYPPGTAPRPPWVAVDQIPAAERARVLHAILQDAWSEARRSPPSSLAADRGVWRLNGEILSNTLEQSIFEAFTILNEEMLRHLFPNEGVIR